MFKHITLLLLISILFIAPPVCYGYSGTVSSSAQIKRLTIIEDEDYRTKRLRTYLEKHNSPLSDHANTFVEVSDEYNIDWRLVPAITGVESTFGKRIPYNSFNAYGWANGKYKFNSWDESIEIVTRSLRSNYLDKGAVSINEISRVYAPPSDSWAWKVRYFMNEIDSTPLNFSL